MPYAVLICCVLSGVADAMFGIAAVRQFTTVFGSTPLPVSVFFGAAIACAAAAIFWAGPVAMRLKQPTNALGSLHVASGAAAIAAALALALNRWLAILILPAMFLAGAAPVFSIAAISTRRAAAARIARIAGIVLAIQAAGACIGAVLGAFAALPYLGLWGTFAIVGLCHFAAAMIAAPDVRAMLARPILGPVTAAPPLDWIVASVAAVWGFGVMQYAALWTRSIAPAAGTSAWSYAMIAALFCFGLAVGFGVSAWQAPNARYPGLTLTLLALANGAVTIGATIAIPRFPRWNVMLLQASGGSLPLYFLGAAAQFSLVLLPSAALQGAMLPFALRSLDRADAGEHRAPALVSRYLALAAAAGWFGAIVAGAWLVPLTGLQGELFLAVAGCAAIATLAVGWLAPWTPRQRIAVAIAPGALAVAGMYAAPAWDRYPFASSALASAPSIAQHGIETHFGLLRRTRFEFYEETTDATVAVNSALSRRLVWIDGRLEGEMNMAQPLLWQFPLALGRPIRDVLLFGLPGAPALLAQSDLHVDIVEPEGGIIDAEKSLNPSILANPRASVRRGDPRIALGSAPPASYDLIVITVASPWLAGSAKWTTREFYRMASAHLRPRGVFSELVLVSRMDFGAIQSVLKAFSAAFPQTLILSTGKNASELILLGSNEPLRLDWGSLARRPSGPESVRGGVLLSRILLGSGEARTVAGDAPANSDGNARAEFSAAANLFRDRSAENGAKLLAHAADPWQFVDNAPPVGDRAAVLLEMTYSAIMTGDLLRGMKFAEDLRAAGNAYDADRLKGDLLYSSDRRGEAVELWLRCVERNPHDVRILERLVAYYRLLRPDQRPPQFNEWAAEAAGRAPR